MVVFVVFIIVVVVVVVVVVFIDSFITHFELFRRWCYNPDRRCTFLKLLSLFSWRFSLSIICPMYNFCYPLRPPFIPIINIFGTKTNPTFFTLQIFSPIPILQHLLHSPQCDTLNPLNPLTYTHLHIKYYKFPCKF